MYHFAGIYAVLQYYKGINELDGLRDCNDGVKIKSVSGLGGNGSDFGLPWQQVKLHA